MSGELCQHFRFARMLDVPGDEALHPGGRAVGNTRHHDIQGPARASMIGSALSGAHAIEMVVHKFPNLGNQLVDAAPLLDLLGYVN